MGVSGRAAAEKGALTGSPAEGHGHGEGPADQGRGRGAVDIPWLQTQLSSIREARAATPAMPGSAPRYPGPARRFGLCSYLHVVGGPNKVGALIVTHVT